MIDFVAVVRRESGRFSECLRNGDFASPVPSCPDWTLADLGWHLTEVQDFWGSIASDLLQDPDSIEARAQRPADEELADLFDDRSQRLIEAVGRHPAETRCWTWDDDGWTIGWVRRRQAHEALIHRVDAELAVGHRTPVDEELAADGIDELMFTMIDGVPDWGTFTPDGSTATLAIDDGRSYGFRFGRFRGVGPQSGTEFDFETFRISRPSGPVIAGSASDLDLWLWGRGGRGVRCEDAALLTRIREIVTAATQ